MSAKPGPLRPHEERPDYKRREAREPAPGNPGLGDSFLIVVEGEVTEKMYFDSIRRMLQVNPVTVRVIHPSCTDAEGLVRAAIQERDNRNENRARGISGYREVSVYDHVWVLFDTDVPSRQSQLGPALELARTNNIHVGHSTPSVEAWLLLHLRNRPGPLVTSDAAERAVSEAWGQRYEKTARVFSELWPALQPNITAAVHRSVEVRDYHRQGGTSFPPDPSTELDLLVRALDASVQPQLRIIR